ncbi:MAG TPA: phophatidylserine decarboxylase associated domain-containing protein [Xanthomonadales bacterium]|nr:phophatidylserine decarboxylase associated domain-containing protein [Xanthomonadales bacterium]
MKHDAATVDARYKRQFAVRAGYLPKKREALHGWNAAMQTKVAGVKAQGEVRIVSESVRELGRLVERDPMVRMYVHEMLEQVQLLDGVPPTPRTVDELLIALDHITRMAPYYDTHSVAFPMSALFSYMMMTDAGEAIFRNAAFNEAIRQILKDWCRYLNAPESRHTLNHGPHGWLSPFAYQDMKLYEFVTDRSDPHWGWKSYNDFFHRAIKPEARPIAGPDDPAVIVSANDGHVLSIARGVKRTDEFWLKGEPFSLADMLDRSAYVDRFVDGYVFQSFLSGANYHRWHAPVDGTVEEAYVVNGLQFSDAESAGPDPGADLSEGYYASVNTRGLVFIRADKKAIGTVCVIPIGITEISSVEITVKAGDEVKKGDQLGYFSYGGSTLALVFEHGAIDHFTAPNPPKGSFDPGDGPPIQVNAQIAVANV